MPIRQRKPREHDASHLKWVRTLPCLGCGRQDGVEAAHIRFGDRRFAARPLGLGEKGDDWRVTPLCKECHDAQHRRGEQEWWALLGISPYYIAPTLYRISGDDYQAHDVIDAWRCRR
jgi:5-methylcytosine-specific restriction endonuclease McrA